MNIEEMKEEMKEKFLEDFEDALEHARMFYFQHNTSMHLRFIKQANDYAFITYHFGIIDSDEYMDCCNQVNELMDL